LSQPVDIIATEKIYSDGMFCANYQAMRRDALMVPEVYNLCQEEGSDDDDQ